MVSGAYELTVCIVKMSRERDVCSVSRGLRVLYASRPNFRRAGPNTWVNLALGAMLGAITGQYIFGEPLRQYWEEARMLEEQASKANDKK